MRLEDKRTSGNEFSMKALVLSMLNQGLRAISVSRFKLSDPKLSDPCGDYQSVAAAMEGLCYIAQIPPTSVPAVRYT